MRSIFKSGKLDQFGMTAAIACAIHCAALPFVITTLPLWGLNFLAHSWVELGMICLSMIIGIWSLTGSYPKHKKALPLLVLLAGFAMIACGHYWLEDLEAVLIPLGGFSIATAHLFNWRYSRSCNHVKNNNTAVANPLQG